jgi:hypothetical protein
MSNKRQIGAGCPRWSKAAFHKADHSAIVCTLVGALSGPTPVDAKCGAIAVNADNYGAFARVE